MLKKLSAILFLTILGFTMLLSTPKTADAAVIDLGVVKPPEVGGRYTVGGPWVVNASSLNVRKGPSTGYSIIGSVSYGEIVTVEGINAGISAFDSAATWVYIEYHVTGTSDTKVGWVCKQYLSPIE
jgi:uncharacterized protein YgiM (DUF1202 family)